MERQCAEAAAGALLPDRALVRNVGALIIRIGVPLKGSLKGSIRDL